MNDYSEDVRLAREGSTEAFARLYATVYEDLYHIALYSLRSPHDAADTVSDTVLDAFCSIKKLRSPEKFRSWIMTILAAKIKRKQRSYFEPADELNENTDLTESFDFESVELREAVENLDTESRLLLSMSVLEGYSSDEISQVCGIKPSTVRSRLTRIKQKLRLELTPEL
ncbi:RNA polymerase sigma-70 factor, ECF subfamily [Ruminococcus flavefaciens]|uniref:RNA polymerase sigma-70 factor, ECF subfamily n=1 Tax=Ruminococcus flavefaciens TaxID=1265 RepID=A0A1H6IHB1_RUMFL|nr:sigma-70 family RNA polymerase sigma factor [Ruminococcus flavefaciens]SEH47292.1 RNA polymerase sigma-70 factor, ECF subfamily [Ruminococcus flavefaciens]